MKTINTLLLLAFAGLAQALTIPKGTLYFDNSKTGYKQVSFVYGTNERKETYAQNMTLDGNKWRVDIAEEVQNMYRFTFVGGELKDGLYQQDFNSFKDSISHKAGLNRTATSDAQMKAGDIFVPQSSDNWAQGYWTSLTLWQASQGGSSSASISGTLPVVYISTTNNAAINSKDVYVTGSLYIDPLTTGQAALGTSQAPIAAQFKGRGNWTWTGFDKKPYRIKFDVKQAVLGMPSNKHWCLMAAADDWLGFLKNPAGHMLSEAIGLRWTPRIVPVELVLNGQYHGLYFLTEHVRIGNNRVNITTQEDNSVDSVSGGWLVEIDNYSEPGNITFQEGNGQNVMITIKDPEVLSTQQRNYIESSIDGLNKAIYGSSESQLWQMLDVDEAAKYYLVQELMEDCESYHGSCFLYKDRDRNDQTAKWFFGPVWDFGNSFNRQKERFIYDGPSFEQYWIGQLATWPDFQKKVREYWYIYYHSTHLSFLSRINDFAGQIAKAAANDAAKWKGTQNYCDNSDMSSRLKDFNNLFNWRVQWLYNQWGEGIAPTRNNDVIFTDDKTNSTHQINKFLQDGRLVIRVNNELYDITGKRIQ